MYETVPQELKDLPNWVGWKLETRDGKPTKVPYSRPGVRAASTNPQDWVNFNDVCNIISSKEKGIGFVFDGNGIVGIDLDHCFNLDGTIKHKFANVLSTLKSYTEISPSGNGLHIFIKCEEHPYYWKDEPTDEHPEGMEHFGRKKNDLEIYSKARYFTITGMKWNGCPLKIIEYTADVVRKICDQILGTRDEVKFTHTTPMSTQLSDEDILKITSHASNAHKFNNLWNGSKSEYNDDDSAADMALASLLAFYSTDANQIERLMRQSGLRRAKWDNHKTYLKSMTIQKAIRDCRVHYEPKSDGSVEEGKEISKQLLDPKEPNNSSIVVGANEKDIEKWNETLLEIRTLNKLKPLPQLPKGIFSDYLEIGVETSYSRPAYHFGALLTLASMILGRKVCVKAGPETIYSNIFTFIVGMSTISGKSSACNAVIKRYGDDINGTTEGNLSNEETPGKKKIISGLLSEAALIQNLNSSSNIFWKWDDAGSFFDGIESWNAPMLSTLCSIYDGNKVERTLSSRGKQNPQDFMWSCDEPFLSILFNMTISDLETHLNGKVASSGFSPRIMWFLEYSGERKSNKDLGDQYEQRIAKISDELKYVNEIIRKRQSNDIIFTTSSAIEDWCTHLTNKFTSTHGDKSNSPSDDMYLTSIQRGMIHAYKIAMIFSVFDPDVLRGIQFAKQFPYRIKITEKYENIAIEIVNDYLIPRSNAVSGICSNADARNAQRKVLIAIDKMGRHATRTQIIRATRLGKRDLKDALDSLIESEELILKPQVGSTKPMEEYIHVVDD
jgi:hypothetical protein